MIDLIEAHVAHLRGRGMSPNTIWGRERLLRYLDHEFSYGVDRMAIEEWESFLGRDEFAPWTRTNYWGHGNGFYRWGVKRQYIEWNPLDYVPRPKPPVGLPHPVSDEQLRITLERARRPFRTAVILAAYAGMRPCEIAAATREQLSEPWIRIHGKGRKTRNVPTHEMIRRELPYLPAGLVMPRRDGGQRLPRHISQAVATHLTAIGLGEITLYDYRHWYATTTLRGGSEDAPDEQLRPVDLRTVQELMGHSSPAVTMIYTQISDRQRQTAVAALPVLNASNLDEAA
jgi:integrase/recombinase XerD